MKKVGRTDGANAGFTLIELLVSMTLLGLVILPVLSRTGSSLARSEQRLADRMQAQAQLEALSIQVRLGERCAGAQDTVLSGRRFRTVVGRAGPDPSGGMHIPLTVLVRAAGRWDTLSTLEVMLWDTENTGSR